MKWNIVLAIAAALAQLVSAWLGTKVTSRKLSISRQRWYDFVFWCVGLIGVAAIGSMAYRSGRQERAHFSWRVTVPTLATSFPVNISEVLFVNRPIAFNVYYKNVGTGSARQARPYSRSSTQEEASPISEKAAIADFENRLASLPLSAGHDMARDDELWLTAYGPVLSPEDVSNITLGRRVIYLVASIGFEDDYGSHIRHMCKVILPPHPGQSLIIWPGGTIAVQECGTYNDEK